MFYVLEVVEFLQKHSDLKFAQVQDGRVLFYDPNDKDHAGFLQKTGAHTIRYSSTNGVHLNLTLANYKRQLLC